MLKNALIATALAATTLYANEKFYLEPDQIALTDQTILVHLDEDLIETDHLMVDQGGLYICSESMRCLECRRPALLDTPCHKRLNPKNTCQKRLNPKNNCHKKLNPKNTCEVT